MAAARIGKSSINWASLAERVPESQKHLYQQFKSKSDSYLRKVTSLPENAPAIDWTTYKTRIPIKGMVDDFQRQYEALKIPYPPNPKVAELDALEKETAADIEKFKQESSARISEYKKQLAYIASLIPIDQMTMEDYRDAYPETAFDPINRPTFWPHEPEDQTTAIEEKEAH
ncbi:hypothetical protein PPYR_10216 [Photinus pyralis]|uniref:ATP synthase subunit d, mitochondrial n=1 Tax=Photinus pyralis TaxID=7054 RepID=A0A1Y1MPW8_PHOPY|nr:ATP synthase subunit d, mitochondrial-like [Photinus pyralis]KAB0796155.1 hypothetical protein PPYR_10216 [Photinus pyralis]